MIQNLSALPIYSSRIKFLGEKWDGNVSLNYCSLLCAHTMKWKFSILECAAAQPKYHMILLHPTCPWMLCRVGLGSTGMYSIVVSSRVGPTRLWFLLEDPTGCTETHLVHVWSVYSFAGTAETSYYPQKSLGEQVDKGKIMGCGLGHSWVLKTLSTSYWFLNPQSHRTPSPQRGLLYAAWSFGARMMGTPLGQSPSLSMVFRCPWCSWIRESGSTSVAGCVWSSCNTVWSFSFPRTQHSGRTKSHE